MKNEKKDTKAEKVIKIIFPDIGLLGKKIGMSRLFSEDGKSFPVTLLDVSSNRVSQIKSSGKDGYDSYQLAFDNKKKNVSLEVEGISQGQWSTFLLELNLMKKAWKPYGVDVKLKAHSINKIIES